LFDDNDNDNNKKVTNRNMSTSRYLNVVVCGS